MNHSPKEKAELASHHVTALEAIVRGVITLSRGGGGNKDLTMSHEKCGSPGESCSVSRPLVPWPHSTGILSVPGSSVSWDRQDKGSPVEKTGDFLQGLIHEGLQKLIPLCPYPQVGP